MVIDDGLGIVYLVDTPQQFWSELDDILEPPRDEVPTLERLDSTLRRYMAICAAYHEQYLQSPLQLEHACNLIAESELFAFHSERMCDIIVEDIRSNTDPHAQLIAYHILLCHGRRRADFFRSQKRWVPLFPLLMDHVLLDIDSDVEDAYFAGSSHGHTTQMQSPGGVVPVPIEAKLRALSIRLLYEVCRVQKFSVQDLRIFDDAFIDFLFDLVEQTRHMQDETFNYSVIKLIVALNEQFMVASLPSEIADQTGEPSEPRNRVLRVLMRRLGSSKTFGENMIFMLNRAERTPEDLCMQLLVLKLVYLLFTNKGTSDFFYTNDLCVLVDVFLRELADLGDESESLRHTYLRVLHPLLTRTQLKDVPYKRPQIMLALEALTSNTRIRDVSATTKRLVERCLSGEWCVQLRAARRQSQEEEQERRSEGSGIGVVRGGGMDTPATVTVERTASAKGRTLKSSKSMEFLKVGAANASTALGTRRPSNASSLNLVTSATLGTGPMSPTSPISPARKGSMDTAIHGQHQPRSISNPQPHPRHAQTMLAPPVPALPSLSDSALVMVEPSYTQAQTQAPHRRAAPPPPTKQRRKPPAIPTTASRNGGMTTIRTTMTASPLAKTAF
uniref:SPIN90/Ldb17 leucine-rich domain-containing protein n=1 Tax=Mycena chlorophos TaxID=658473 RepID=A0ABQ0M460_MYCCL|nr:predicted protein [Mycena chlorophos]